MAGSTRVPRPDPREIDYEPESSFVTRPVRIAAAWSWRIVIIVLALIPVWWLISKAAIIIVPLLVAMLLTALIVPLTNRLDRVGWPKWASMLMGLLALFVSVGALIGLIVLAFRTGQQFDQADILRRYNEFLEWAQTLPFQIGEDQLSVWLQNAVTWAQSNIGPLIEQTLSAGTTIASVLTGAVFTIFAVIFYLLDGRRIWLFLVSLFPRAARAAVDGAGERAWISTGHYVRVQVIVALIDALGVFIGAVILNVPYALAIGIIVFLMSFVPLIGTFLSGTVAVAIALVANGFWNAIIMLIIVVAVVSIEANVLQPIIMGQAVEIHPLGILVSVSAGSLFAGIGGAVFAVPAVAAVNTMTKYIASGRWRGKPDPCGGLRDDDDDSARIPYRRPLVKRRKPKKEAQA